MKRRHVRTRQTTIKFQKGSLPDERQVNLRPGSYRLYFGDRYYASFIVNENRTVEFYGNELIIKADEE